MEGNGHPQKVDNKLYTRLFYMIILMLTMFSYSYSQECVKASWAKSYGGNSLYNKIIDGNRASDGNFILLGSYGSAPLALDSFVLPADDILNYYLARQDTSGTFLQAKRVMYGSGLVPIKMSTGTDGCTYITGYWEGIAYIGDDTLPDAARKRVFVARFDPLFDKQWVIQTSWTSADCKPCDITTDFQNNAYITGNFEDNAFIIDSFTLMNQGGYNMWK